MTSATPLAPLPRLPHVACLARPLSLDSLVPLTADTRSLARQQFSSLEDWLSAPTTLQLPPAPDRVPAGAHGTRVAAIAPPDPYPAARQRRCGPRPAGRPGRKASHLLPPSAAYASAEDHLWSRPDHTHELLTGWRRQHPSV